MRTAGPGQHPIVKPTCLKGTNPRDHHDTAIFDAKKRTTARKAVIVQVHAASMVPKFGVATAPNGSPVRLIKRPGLAFQLGNETSIPPRHLADHGNTQSLKHRRVLPVDEQCLDPCSVIESGQNVLLPDIRGGKRSCHVHRVHRKPERRSGLACRETRLRLEICAVALERPVMIGEAEHGAIGPAQSPAIAKAGDFPFNVRGQCFAC